MTIIGDPRKRIHHAVSSAERRSTGTRRWRGCAAGCAGAAGRGGLRRGRRPPPPAGGGSAGPSVGQVRLRSGERDSVMAFSNASLAAPSRPATEGQAKLVGGLLAASVAVVQHARCERTGGTAPRGPRRGRDRCADRRCRRLTAGPARRLRMHARPPAGTDRRFLSVRACRRPARQGGTHAGGVRDQSAGGHEAWSVAGSDNAGTHPDSCFQGLPLRRDGNDPEPAASPLLKT